MPEASNSRRHPDGAVDVHRAQAVFKRRAVLAVGVMLAAALPLLSASAQSDGHKILNPADMKWSAAPPALPPGAQATVLYGDPGKEGLFAIRIKFPKDYAIGPHTHPNPEIVTIVSGTFRVGMGETADRQKAQALGAGSFFAMPPGTAHYAFADEDTVLQINSTGPWGLNYLNPNDDPRKKSQ